MDRLVASWLWRSCMCSISSRIELFADAGSPLFASIFNHRNHTAFWPSDWEFLSHLLSFPLVGLGREWHSQPSPLHVTPSGDRRTKFARRNICIAHQLHLHVQINAIDVISLPFVACVLRINLIPVGAWSPNLSTLHGSFVPSATPEQSVVSIIIEFYDVNCYI